MTLSTSSHASVTVLDSRHEAIAEELYRALCERRCITPIRDREPVLQIDDAYAISRAVLRRRLASGERIVGKKIGVTSAAVQNMLGVHQPDFGFLTDRMQVRDGDEVRIADHLIQPRAEAEIALILKSDLRGPGISAKDVLAATESIAPAFEIVDSRIANWDIRIVDTVADNASSGVFVLGAARAAPDMHDLASLEVHVWKNDQPLSRGQGSAVQGSPLASVAWLANTLGTYGVSLNAGEIILSGSLVPLENAAPGDHFRLSLIGVGTADISFC